MPICQYVRNLIRNSHMAVDFAQLHIPNEIIDLIFQSTTTTKQIVNLALVCKRWYSIIENSYDIFKNIKINCIKTDADINSLIRSPLFKNACMFDLRDIHEGCNQDITNDGIKKLAIHFKKIYYIDLARCINITYEGMEYLALNCKYLSQLYLDYHDVEDDMIKIFAINCKNLNHLSLNSCETITDNGLKELAINAKNLYWLSLDCCPEITDDGIEYLAIHCDSLRALNLSNCSLTDLSLNILSVHCRNLTKINLSYNPNITDQGLYALTTKRNTRLKDGFKPINAIYLEHCNNITDNGIKNLVVDSGHLRALSLGFTKITNDTLKMLANNGFLEKLYMLNLSDLDISDEALKDISMYTKNLHELYLRYCKHITDVGLTYVARNIKNLHKLDISFCPKISHVGVKELAIHSKHLRILSLYQCSANINGIIYLAFYSKNLCEVESGPGIMPIACKEIFDSRKKLIYNQKTKLIFVFHSTAIRSSL